MNPRPDPNRRFAPPLAAVLILAVGLAQAARAADDSSQAPEQTQKREGAPGQPRPNQPAGHVPELRDETFRLVDAYFISNLQESLGLTNDQFARILPLVKKVQSDRRDFARRRMQALRQLRKTLSSGSATEASVTELLKDLKAASADERAGTLTNLEALDAELTPLQQAKYRVFEAEVDLRLRHLLARSQDRQKRPNR
jgi:Spy/CpxP family protein refolding chaperone